MPSTAPLFDGVHTAVEDRQSGIMPDNRRKVPRSREACRPNQIAAKRFCRSSSAWM